MYSNIITIKRTKVTWDNFYKSIASGDPRKIVYGYITTTIEAMLTRISTRSKLDAYSLNCLNGVYNSVINTCVCFEGYKKRDCSMANPEWLELSESKWNTSKLILEEMISRNGIEPPTEVKISSQISEMYHMFETFDEVPQKMVDMALSIFKKQQIDVKNMFHVSLSNTLTNAMISTLQLMIKSRLSNNGIVSQSFKTDILSIADNLTYIRLRNQISSKIDTNIFSLITIKVYPSELSRLSVFYGDSKVTYPTMMTKYFNNLNLRKIVYTRIIKTPVQSTTSVKHEEIENGELFTYTIPLDSVLSSQILNQNTTIPQREKVISYSFFYIKNFTDSTTILREGNYIRNISISSQMVCESDGFCDVGVLGYNYYECKCSQATQVSLTEKATRSVQITQEIVPQNPESAIWAYLGFLAFLMVLPIMAIISVVSVSIYCMRKRKAPKQNQELKNV